MSEQDVVKRHLESLRSNLKIRNQPKCLELVGIIVEYFESSPASTTEINYAIELLLKWNDQKINVLRFLAQSLHFDNAQKFGVVNKKIFELIQSLVQLHPEKLKPFSKDVIGICVVFLHSPQSNASEKEGAAQTIQDFIFREALSEEVAVEQIIPDVMKVFSQKNPPVRVQQTIFELLGLVSKNHPNKFPPSKAEELRNKMLNTIQSLFKDDKATTSLMLISGAVDGLKNHLINFTPPLADDPAFSEKLYECMLQLSDPDKFPGSTNRVAFRNMLLLIHAHADVHTIPSLLFRDYKLWHKQLIKWITSSSYDDKFSGIQATQSFHQQIANVLESVSSDEDERTLLFFMKYFQETLESPNSQPHQIRIAIRGIGLMAAACKLLLEPKYLSERFDLVMQRTEFSYHTKDRLKRREVLEHLPHYVESLSKIMNQLDEISGIQLLSLESIIVILIKDFHYLSTAHHALVVTALLDTFTNLQMQGGQALDNILESVVWQGVLWTCSHQLVYDLQDNIENIKDWKETITYRKYLPLWKGMISPVDKKHQQMAKQIYSHFIKDLFLIIDKLDLSTKKRKFHDESVGTEKEFYFSDPGLDLEPVRAENYQILYNLVQFYDDVISSQTNEFLKENFIEWLDLWIENTIQLAMKHPLVSGFLHLIEIALKEVDRLEYASDIENEQVKKMMEPLSSFVKTMMIMRCQQMSGELQVACLQLIFQVPTTILNYHVPEMIPIFVIGFSVGQGMLNIANRALTCLDRLVDTNSESPKTRRQILEEVLPCLETYLSGRDGGETSVKDYKKKLKVTAAETDLMRFKKRILSFLGNFDPDEAQLVLSKFEQKLVRDHITDVFRVRLECSGDSSPLIFLDEIVERICQLAMSSSERATRISACELLHCLVLYMMGKNLESSATLPLWKDFCMNLIILGADKDQTIRQLFEPLLMQMMHFYSQPSKILNPMATTLIEGLLGSICYRGNSGVQDLSARLLREFLIWLYRSTDAKQRQASPIKLVDLFYEMKKMSIETNSSRRTGATLAFNNIYRIIREDENLINVYWIYLLDVFTTNFKSCEDFSVDINTSFMDGRRFEQVSASLDHLTRVFVERSDLFHRSNSDRIRPAGFEGITLPDVLKWLFRECGRTQFHYRHKCMDIFAKLLTECGSKEDFYNQNLGLHTILSIGEENGIAKYPDLNHLADCQDPIFQEIYKWMQSFLTSLDFYIWILEQQLIPNHEIIDFIQRSIIMKTISFFLKNIVNKDNLDILKNINEALFCKSQISFETKLCNRNLDNIDIIRCFLLMRVIDFLTILLNEDIVTYFWKDNEAELLKITKLLVFKPHRLQIDFQSKNPLLQLPSRLTNFITSISKHAFEEFRGQLIILLERKLMKHLNMFCQDFKNLMEESSVKALNTNKLNGLNLLITKLRNLLRLNALSENLLYKTSEVLLTNLFNAVAETKAGIARPKHLSPLTKRFAAGIMQLCFEIGVFLPKIIAFSFNDSRLKVSDACIVNHGEHFMQTFKNQIFTMFTSMLTETIETIVKEMAETNDSNRLRLFSILTDLNEFIFKHHQDNIELLQENITVEIAQWPRILKISSCMENKQNCVDLAIISLVTHMAMTSPVELHQLGPKLDNLQNWILALFENRDNSLELKAKAVLLLPCIASPEVKTNEKLIKALNSIQQKHMPLRSHEFPEGSLERAGLVSIMNALFKSLTRSKSPVIYRFIINATIADDNYILESQLQQVQMELMENSSPEEQEVIVTQTFDAFLNDSYEHEIRLNFVSRFLMTVMKNCHVDVMLGFFKKNMYLIWNLIDSPLNFDAENALVSRCGGYMILEAFVASVPKEKIDNDTFNYGGKINKGEVFIKDLIRKTLEVRKDVVFIVDDPVKQELLRKFHCYCYRVLASTVSNTKDKPELFDLTLFKENVKNGCIWNKLIDVRNNDLYSNWTQEFDELPRMKEYIVSIKDLQTNEANTSRKYIETVSIFDRSLSQSLTKSDLTYSVVYSNREALEKDQLRRDMEHQKTIKVQLESTPVNDHEVMSVLVGVINSIYQKKISPVVNLDKYETKKYEWVISLANSIRNSDNHKNIRIFLAKLVDNCRNIFVFYAKQMLGAILSTITDGCLGTQMNFFITDVVVMLLSWSHVYKPTEMSEKQDACALLKFLMENAYDENDEVFKMNLELIKKVVETWSEVLKENIPNQALLDLLQRPQQQESTHQIKCGIQLNAVLLANGLVPWANSDQQKLFIEATVGCFNNSNARVYQAAAQLLGMFLNQIVGSQAVQEGAEHFELISQITQRLHRIRQKNTNDINVFLQILYGIQKGFPLILDDFMTLIKFNIPGAVKKIKCIYLEMYLARLEIDDENVYREIIAIGTKDLLKHNEFQLLALHIINKALVHLNSAEVSGLMDELLILMHSPNDDVRRVLYEIMIFIVERFRKDETFEKKKAMNVLLKGFTDSDQQIYNRVNNFFSVEGELSRKFSTRFQDLLQNYYDPSLEKEFLHYATQLLLDIPLREPLSKLSLLDYDKTKDKDFFEYPISTKSHSQRSLPPLFIQSQQTQLLAGDGSVYDQMIRATQLDGGNQAFSQTQDPIEMSQVPQTFTFKQSQDSLFVSLKPQFLDRRSNTCSLREEGLNAEHVIVRSKEKSKPDAFDYLRRRISKKDSNLKSKEYALKAIDRRNYFQAKQDERIKKSREGRNVVLYRRYRLGDFPDFFFTGLAILMPLHALARNDDAIARGIFISIFQAIIDMLKRSTDDSEKLFYDSINQSITSILQRSKNTDSFMLGTLIEMAMKSEKYMEISPDVLANVSSMSNLVVTGVLFLESQLIHLLKAPGSDDGEEPSAKRKRLAEDTTSTNHWLKLIELNYKMNEYEVLLGIFTEKLNLAPETKKQLVKAIDSESSGGYHDASVVYEDLISRGAARNNSEKEFYYQSYFNCLANLSDWRKIAEQVRTQFDSYNEVWDEKFPFYKETLLPHLLKSELRMILSEDSDDEFIKILEDWFNDQEKCNYLRVKFPEEIAMIHILDRKFNEGCVEVENSLRNLGNEWSCLEMLDDKIKCLKYARTIAELNNFIQLMTSANIAPRIDKLYQNWRLSQPKPSDSLVHWGDLLSYRRNFHRVIDTEKQQDLNCLLDIQRDLINVAFAQNNCDAARFFINGLKDEIRLNRSDEKIMKCQLAIAKYNMILAEQKLDEPDDQIMKLCSGLDKLVKHVFKTPISRDFPRILIESHCTASDISWKLWMVQESCHSQGIELPDAYKQQILKVIGAAYDETDVAQNLLSYSEMSLKKARSLAQKHFDENFSSDNENLLAETYLKLGKFYHQVSGTGIVSSTELQLKMMKSIFRAIAYGSRDAKIYIPYILQLSDLKSNALVQEFNQELSMVPEWMFISYISQMLSNYDFEQDCYLDELLLRLAVKYPSAFYFPFKLSQNLYLNLRGSEGMQKRHVSKLIEATSNPSLEKFVNSLQCLVLPEKMLETHFLSFKQFIESNRANMNNEKFQEGLQKLIHDVFEHNREFKGLSFEAIKDFQHKFQVIKKMNWVEQERAIIDKLSSLRIQIERISRRRISSLELHKLCHWLAEYKWCGERDFIEIPGQYTGESRPFIEQHVKIVRFEHKLKVFSSKQQPVEIKMHGSDGRVYSYIIKYGEDLRQDQRVQQALELMSKQLSSDKNCKQNHLRIQTYQVIPINQHCGLLSVVQNATTIADYLQENAQHLFEENFQDFLPNIKEKFRAFLLCDTFFVSWAKTYEIAVTRRSRLELAEELATMEDMIPKDIIRRALMNSAMSLETYFILRKNFITSLAAMNIAHWLLGIGDRHLSNILIELKTGRLIGIDFGIAFGAAVNLVVPEIIPFRLTSHFVNVIEPMGIEGMIKKNMKHVLRCLRNYKQMILICLEMFVKEPTMDWQMRAKMKSIGNVEQDVSLASSDWNPESRIAIVQRKLEGENPVSIIKYELSISQVAVNENLLKRYEALAEGARDSLRKNMKTGELTADEQVICLAEMATDKALLATTYLGWDPWI